MEYPLNQSAWRRGWNDTTAAKSSWPFYVLDAVVATAIGGVFEWYWGLVTLLTGLFCLWIVKTASAPIKQRNEARKQVQALLNEKVPSFSVSAATGKRGADYERTEHLMWAELQVTNTSTEELRDVQVNIAECLTLQEKQNSVNQNDFIMWDFLGMRPFCVYWSERQAQPKQISLDIPGGASRVALIAFQDDSNGGQFYFNAPFNPRIFTGVRIDVEITGFGTALWRGDFYIECHPNYLEGERAKFEFVEWDKWISNRNVTLLESDR